MAEQKIEVIENVWNDTDSIKLIGQTGLLVHESCTGFCEVMLDCGRMVNLYIDELKLI